VQNPRRVPITLPDLGAPRAAFSLWHVRIGDRVTEGDRIAEVLVPGAVFDVSAPVSGAITEQDARPGDRLSPGQVIGAIREEE
jgi:pyruvate/2-oxoglutarate dehydrogenase complex dihydrolipoamide acyltransferase (E2) component